MKSTSVWCLPVEVCLIFLGLKSFWKSSSALDSVCCYVQWERDGRKQWVTGVGLKWRMLTIIYRKQRLTNLLIAWIVCAQNTGHIHNVIWHHQHASLVFWAVLIILITLKNTGENSLRISFIETAKIVTIKGRDIFGCLQGNICINFHPKKVTCHRKILFWEENKL